MSATHRVRVRYADCDMQGVVYNAHYLTFIDDAFDTWLRRLHRDYEGHGWEVMLKRVELSWAGPARLAEEIDISMAATRFGTTSLDIGFTGSVDGRDVFEATVTYVVVDHDDYTPVAIPDELRDHLRS